MKHQGSDRPVVIFDGTCGFCSRLVSFILRHDARGELLFSPNSSPFGMKLLSSYNLVEASKDTIVVVAAERALTRSDATIYIAEHLRVPYSLFRYLRLIPRSLRDVGYRVVAASRKFLPGNTDACEFLPPDKRDRIVEEV